MPNERVIKSRRIMQRDLDFISEYIREELSVRQRNEYRVSHERIWKEVDRQVSMEAPIAVNRNQSDADPWIAAEPIKDYHNAVQLGNLSDALEVLAADAMRLLFPNDRWFQPTIENDRDIDEEGGAEFNAQGEKVESAVLRSLMYQQHSDFGFRDKVKACLKESLKHGGFVAECRWDNQPKFYKDGGVDGTAAPALIPYSMRNSYPDPSPTVSGMEIFYRGSMIVESNIKLKKLLDMPGWMNKEKVRDKMTKDRKKSREDVDLVTYWGDLYLDRAEGGIYLPNRKVVMAEDIIVYTEQNETPFIPIIYAGYESDDILDPYYTSPLVKRAPMHKVATESANKYLDAVDRVTEPPIFYNALDPRLSKDGGPDMSPGGMNATQGAADIKFPPLPDPSHALNGMLMAMQHVDRGTAVDSIRAGVSPGTEQTATEVIKQDQRSEVRSIDFVGVMERQVLRPFLYMQHHLNRMHLQNYPFRNTEIHTPNFLRASKSDLPNVVHFDVVGSKNVLGEEARNQKFMQAIAISSGNQEIAARTDWDAVAEEVWNTTGMKDPERFMVTSEEQEQIAAQVQEVMAQAQEQIGAMQEEIAKLQDQTAKQSLGLEANKSEKEALQTDINSLEEKIRVMEAAEQAKNKLLGLREKIRAEAENSEDQNAAQIEAVKQANQETQRALGEVAQAVSANEQSKQQKNALVLEFLGKRGGEVGKLAERLK